MQRWRPALISVTNQTPLLIAGSSLVSAFGLLSLWLAVSRMGRVRHEGVNGLTRAYCIDAVVGESFRFTKSLILLAVLATTPPIPPALTLHRNQGIFAVDLLMGTYSAYVMYRRHRREKRYGVTLQ